MSRLTNGVDLNELFRRYEARIVRHALAMTRDVHEAQDVTQETFVRAQTRLDALREPDAAAAWLYRVATNLCLDRFRRSARRGPVDDFDQCTQFESSEPRLDQVAEQAEMSTCVREFLDDIPDDQRAAILLHDYEGLTTPEIAKLLGITVANVKIRLHRGRARLRDALGAGCDFSHDDRGVLVCERQQEDADAKMMG